MRWREGRGIWTSSLTIPGSHRFPMMLLGPLQILLVGWGSRTRASRCRRTGPSEIPCKSSGFGCALPSGGYPSRLKAMSRHTTFLIGLVPMLAQGNSTNVIGVSTHPLHLLLILIRPWGFLLRIPSTLFLGLAGTEGPFVTTPYSLLWRMTWVVWEIRTLSQSRASAMVSGGKMKFAFS